MQNAQTQRLWLQLQQGAYRAYIRLRFADKLLLPAEIPCCGARNMGYYTRLFKRTVLIIFSGGLFCESSII